MTKDVVLPELAESVVEGEVVSWLVETGARVEADQPLVEVMTDKVTVELPSPFAGTLTEQVAAVGDVVQVGAVLARIDEQSRPANPGAAPAADEPPAESVVSQRAEPPAGEAGTDTAATRSDAVGAGDADADDEDHGDERSLFRAEAPSVGGPVLQVRRLRRSEGPEAREQARRPASHAARSAPARGAFGRVVAVPAARRLARELGVPIEQVEGSGPSGRVRVADVERHTREGQRGGAGVMPAPPRYRTPPGLAERETRVPLRGLRRAIAQQLSASHLHTVRALHVDEADVTALVRLRETLKPRAEARGVALSYLPFVMKAVVSALQAYPALNSSLDEAAQEVVLKDYVNVGLAVATEAGLVVPVVHGAERRSLLELAEESRRLADAARHAALEPEDVQGSSFTITNIGSIGGLFSFPIINAPDAAILGMHSIRRRPVVLEDDIIVARPMLYLSLSFDHRLVDGAEASRFTTHVIDLLQTPEALLLDAR
jgi:2-oxoisovalerate dehydrogenase E2 component (dihydrolipoyl transacylase)